MCLVRDRPPVDRVHGSMPPDRVAELLAANPQLERVTLQGLGEPMLSPHLDDLVALVRAHGVSVGFNTNGTLLTRSRAERLFDAGVSWLHVSVDGATAETYEAIRDGARFDRLCANLEQLGDLVAARRPDVPDVELVFVAMRRNIGELPLLVERAAGWGLPAVWVQNLSHSFSDELDEPGFVRIRRYTDREALWTSGADTYGHHLESARRRAAELGVALRLPPRFDVDGERGDGPAHEVGADDVRAGCDWPWRSSYVNHDGVVQPCCMLMGSARAPLGNVAESSFDEVWHGDAYAGFRERLLGSDPPEVCRGCSMYRRVF